MEETYKDKLKKFKKTMKMKKNINLKYDLKIFLQCKEPVCNYSRK